MRVYVNLYEKILERLALKTKVSIFRRSKFASYDEWDDNHVAEDQVEIDQAFALQQGERLSTGCIRRASS